MFSRSEDVEVHALSKRGWSISAIARHLDCDRKTVRAYPNGEREPGVRRSSAPDLLAPFVGAGGSARTGTSETTGTSVSSCSTRAAGAVADSDVTGFARIAFAVADHGDGRSETASAA